MHPVFFKGMDISSLEEILAKGHRFYDFDGNEIAPFTLLKKYGVNSIRLRIWNEPSAVPEAHGYCDLNHTLTMAKKIKEEGFHFVLDFHYSDWWADPSQQKKPRAWEGLSIPELKAALYQYTKDCLLALKEIDCLPDMVQVGNEIRSGMVFPEGEVPNYNQLASLVNEGIRACREVSSDIQVMIHLDQGGRFYCLKDWFDHMFEAGMASIDCIGISFYSFWHGTFLDLKTSVESLIDRYQLPVCVVETAHPWRRSEMGYVTKDQEAIAGFEAGKVEQAKSLHLILKIMASIPNQMGMGVYYWEPLSVDEESSWAENMGMVDDKGNLLPSFLLLKAFDPKSPNDILIKETIPEFPKEFHIPNDFESYIRHLYSLANSNAKLAEGDNLIPNGDFKAGLQDWWLLYEKEKVDLTQEDAAIFFEGHQNFQLDLHKEIYLAKSGHYRLRLCYQGSNTTGVHVYLFCKVLSCMEERLYEKEIYPADYQWLHYELEDLALPAGQIQLGLRIEAPPIWGKIKELSLIEEGVEEKTA